MRSRCSPSRVPCAYIRAELCLPTQWHPDKNQDQIELATETFKQIQNAYAVLSDPHERSWYDAHREAILRGKSGTRDEQEDDDDDPVSNLWAFFSTSAYSGFGDDEEGFYTVYDKVFMDLDEEERRFAERPSDRRSPRFGDSKVGPCEQCALLLATRCVTRMRTAKSDSRRQRSYE